MLKKSYDDYIDLMLYDFPLDRINEIIVSDVTGYGTTLDEKVLEIKRLEKIVADQREQGAGLNMQFKTMPVKSRISPEEDTVIFMDEFEISMLVDGTKNIIPVRLSSVFEFSNNTWKLVHLHGSKAVETEEDTWHLNEWKQKNEQLQKLVDEKTAELFEKNRELEIEAALEKVRSRSLAMKQSDELQEVISTVFIQMQHLGIKADASLINILSDESKDFYLWIGTVGQTYAQKIRIPYIQHPVFDVFYEARDRGETFMTNALSRADKDSFFEYAFKYSDLKLMPDDRKKYVMDSAGFARSFAWSKNSGITIQNYAGIPYSDQENEILKRFAHVFEQAYTRFLDVKTAEAQAREADNRAALDRVRGEIASMRSKEDLTLITPLIWKELNSLGVSFIRCGVLIMDENKKIIHTYLSKPNGDSLSAFELSFDSKEIGVGAVKHWKRNEIYYEYWDKNQFVSFMQNLIKTGQIENPESYQGDYEPPESLFLHLVPFKQGMLYVGNTNSLKPEEIQLVQALAQTMSVAYSRYEDFRLLEEAKNQIEKTLIVLKSTQSQLIQAEKMASLGELTAGIAHEIQNPLNFVNNFSEVSRELIEEMKEELTEGSKQYAAGSLQSGEGKLKLANEIADDLELNLEKINQHGKRAADIVKGMLQHSRTSSGQKELTDINALTDEYLRLAYHGLRAKDKS
ncbi:MAG TPA: histidine kinase dimerization/phospho-acceptor domain-containing protein, partial [Draconibacterium sp.]|nr:histidine kinase dimerization/phospho-acceptor domain-containing protein [Draconibacterium sp.]